MCASRWWPRGRRFSSSARSAPSAAVRCSSSTSHATLDRSPRCSRSLSSPVRELDRYCICIRTNAILFASWNSSTLSRCRWHATSSYLICPQHLMIWPVHWPRWHDSYLSASCLLVFDQSESLTPSPACRKRRADRVGRLHRADRVRVRRAPLVRVRRRLPFSDIDAHSSIASPRISSAPYYKRLKAGAFEPLLIALHSWHIHRGCTTLDIVNMHYTRYVNYCINVFTSSSRAIT